jgi:hypothetical protein
LETVLKITEKREIKDSWKKKKGKQHSGVLLHQKFPPEEISKGSSLSPSFFWYSHKRGFIPYISKYLNWFKPLCCSLDSFFFFFFFFILSPYLLFGVLENREITSLQKKKKKKENKTKQ